MTLLTVRVALSLQINLDVWEREHPSDVNSHRLRQDVKAWVLENIEDLDAVEAARLVNGPHR